MAVLQKSAFARAIAVACLIAPITLFAQSPQGSCGEFTIAAIPDSQNYLDFRHQKSHGFPVNGYELFFEQMQYIADNARSNGGGIVFVTHLGDIWQNRV